MMANITRTCDILARVRGLGAGVSIDDFGTGYSSLAYLKRLPVDELKVDRSFVRNLATDAGDMAITRATITLGHDLGLSVVAEGAEDIATLDLLMALGCDQVQGYVHSKPLPIDGLCAGWQPAPRRPARRPSCNRWPEATRPRVAARQRSGTADRRRATPRRAAGC